MGRVLVDFPTFKTIWAGLDEEKKAKVREYITIFVDFREHIKERDFHESNEKLEKVTSLQGECEGSGIDGKFLTTLSATLADSLVSRDLDSDIYKTDIEKFIEKEILN